MAKPQKPSEKPTALAHASGPLTKAEHALLAEALQRAEGARNIVESALLDFGRWLLVDVFKDDAGAALEGRRDNPVWCELLARAGGPTLRLSERFLYVALRIAAHDKRIQDDSWRLLEPGRKELLLPLKEPPLLRKAAQHVVAMKLSQRATREYVRATIADQGGERKSRVTAGQFQSHVRRFRAHVEDATYKRRVARTLKDLGDEDRRALKEELSALRGWVAEMLAAVR